jgi:Zn-dependent protease
MLSLEVIVAIVSSLLLMGLFALRTKVTPKASLLIRATPEAVFKLIDIADGKKEDWGQIQITTDLIDSAKGIYKKTYRSTMSNGTVRSVNALFSIRERFASQKLVVDRAGLEGRPTNNELLRQTFQVTPQPDGSRLHITYEWGPRPLIAHLFARADLWGGIFRLRGLAEKGVPVEWPYAAITAAMSLFTGFLSLWAFAIFIGWTWSAIVIFSLFIHEIGHLISYRIMGQPWGRIIFLPFLGALAMPRFSFESQGQMVFAALMGPGFSLLLAVACMLSLLVSGDINPYVAGLGWITCLLNIFNLLPAEPLDGGIALRTIFARYFGNSARYALMAVGIVIVGFGILTSKIMLIMFGGIAIFMNLKPRKIDSGLISLTRMQLVLSLLFYTNLVAFYVILYEGVFSAGFTMIENSIKNDVR